MNNELVSIVTPVYNAERFIEKTIKTVQEQTYENWELILVNDCSSDKSAEIIERFAKKDKRVRLINLEKNSGSATARNTAIKNSKVGLLLFWMLMISGKKTN